MRVTSRLGTVQPECHRERLSARRLAGIPAPGVGHRCLTVAAPSRHAGSGGRGPGRPDAAARGTGLSGPAHALGCLDARTFSRHILPSVFAPVLVVGTLGVAGAILSGAALSVLGLGAMLSDGRSYLRQPTGCNRTRAVLL